MKISEFAAMNKVTTKMLRHYDEIGLLKPASIDPLTGYRIYESEQSRYLSWILILKNLDFSLSEIQQMLSSAISYDRFMENLRLKRIEISLGMNDQIQKKLQIEKLIQFVEKEGFEMSKQINLLDFNTENVNEIKKNMPHMEDLLENMENILESIQPDDYISILRLDLSHFKQVNDDFGYDVGDRVILTFYKMIEEVVGRYPCKSTLGRLGGDEFAIFVLADDISSKEIGKNIITRMQEFDFSSLGCHKQVNCYIGIISQKSGTIQNIRKLLDDTIEALGSARREGPNRIFSQIY